MTIRIQMKRFGENVRMIGHNYLWASRQLKLSATKQKEESSYSLKKTMVYNIFREEPDWHDNMQLEIKGDSRHNNMYVFFYMYYYIWCVKILWDKTIIIPIFIREETEGKNIK